MTRWATVSVLRSLEADCGALRWNGCLARHAERYQPVGWRKTSPHAGHRQRGHGPSLSARRAPQAVLPNHARLADGLADLGLERAGLVSTAPGATPQPGRGALGRRAVQTNVPVWMGSSLFGPARSLAATPSPLALRLPPLMPALDVYALPSI